MKYLGSKITSILIGVISFATPAQALIYIPPHAEYKGYSYTLSTPITYVNYYSTIDFLLPSPTPKFNLIVNQNDASLVAGAISTEIQLNTKIRFSVTDPTAFGWSSYNFYFSNISLDWYAGDLPRYISATSQVSPSVSGFPYENVVLSASSNQFESVKFNATGSLLTYSFESRSSDKSQPLIFDFDLGALPPRFLFIAQSAVTAVPEPAASLIALMGLVVVFVRKRLTQRTRQKSIK